MCPADVIAHTLPYGRRRRHVAVAEPVSAETTENARGALARSPRARPSRRPTGRSRPRSLFHPMRPHATALRPVSEHVARGCEPQRGFPAPRVRALPDLHALPRLRRARPRAAVDTDAHVDGDAAVRP